MKNSKPSSNFLWRTLLSFLLATVGLNSYAQKATQPVLGHRTVEIMKVGKLEFKDLNKNKKLDKYEDWRLPIDKRIKDLISKMSLEEKIGFMIMSTTRMAGDYSFQQNPPKAEITSGFNEEDLVQTTNMFTRKPLPIPTMTAAGTTKAVLTYNLRHFILRANTSAKTMANGRITCRLCPKVHDWEFLPPWLPTREIMLPWITPLV